MTKNELITSPDVELVRRLEASPTEQFYEWERRGRGWQLWDGPTYLEPPFRPFFHINLSQFTCLDNGRRHTWLSRLVEIISSKWIRSQDQPQSAQAIDPDLLNLIAEPVLPPFEGGDRILELQAVLPIDAKVANETFSAFLLSLAYCSRPLSFEVVGTSEAITVQLACRECDAVQVHQQLSAHFPEAVISRAMDSLRNQWIGHQESPNLVVEFGLSREFMLPLKSLPGSAIDPLVAVTGALSNLRQGEVAVLQVLFESVRHPWSESIFRAITDGEGHSFFSDAPEMVGLAKQKISSPLFAAVIRLAAKAADEDDALEILRAMSGGLARLANPTVNELIPLDNEGYDPIEHEVDLLLRQTHRGGMLLNADELVSLVHLPSAFVRSPKLTRLTRRTKKAPELAYGHNFILGENDHDGRINNLGLSTEQRLKHVHVIGASGTGKSTFLLNLILQDIEAGNGLAVLDPHGDLIDQILERIPEKRHEDVILLDPSDEAHPIGFNIVSAHSDIEKHLLSSDLVGVFKRLSTSWGDQMTSVLGNAILAFLESERGGTLADLRRFLVEKDYRQEYMQTVKDHEVVYYWQKEFPLLAGKPQAPLLTRLDAFLRPKLIRHMVAQKENKIDFAEIMNGGKILLAKLSQGAIGEENAYLLGSLIVSKFHQMALSRQELKESERRPFFLYIDEFHNFITPSMAQILSGARKYRLGLILAHQELRQLGGAASEITSAVLSNPFTRVCFRVGDEDARKLESGLSFFEARDLQNLGTGEAICRIERAEYDFNLRTNPLPDFDAAVGRLGQQRIISLSRDKYASRREDVEAELAKWTPQHPPEMIAPRLNAVEVRGGSPTEGKTPESAHKEESEFKPHLAELSFIPEVPPSAHESVIGESESSQVQAKINKRAKSIPAEEATLGRGGQQHKYLQQLIKQWAEGMGWRATIEKPILEGTGSIDVFLEKQDRCIACEICVTSSVDQELAHIERCLQAGIEFVASVSLDDKRLAKIAATAKLKFDLSKFEKIRFVLPEGLFLFVEGLDAQLAEQVGVRKGFKVKTSYRVTGAEEKSVKKRLLSQVILGSLDALRKQNEKK